MADLFATLTGFLSATRTAITGRQDTLILPPPQTAAEMASRDRIVALHAAAVQGDGGAFAALRDLADRGTSYERRAGSVALADLSARRAIGGIGATAAGAAARVEPAGLVRTTAIGTVILIIVLLSAATAKKG